MEDDIRFMQLAIEKAREGIKKGGGPFGACIVKGSGNNAKVISCEHNSVIPGCDSTAHAEVNAIPRAHLQAKPGAWAAEVATLPDLASALVSAAALRV